MTQSKTRKAVALTILFLVAVSAMGQAPPWAAPEWLLGTWYSEDDAGYSYLLSWTQRSMAMTVTRAGAAPMRLTLDDLPHGREDRVGIQGHEFITEISYQRDAAGFALSLMPDDYPLVYLIAFRRFEDGELVVLQVSGQRGSEETAVMFFSPH